MFLCKQNMWSILVVVWFSAIILHTQSDDKIPYSRGTICNIEGYFNARGNLSVNRYFCVPDSLCRKGISRYPMMDYDGCDSVMNSPNTEKLVCCHIQEIHEDLKTHFANQTYLTGLKSFMMCKEYSHFICGPQGSYCSIDATEAQKFRGLPTAISKYPHTALIGYYHFFKGAWVWFCQGTIVSKTYILTVWSCLTDGDEPATNVKIGESRLCHLDYCSDSAEEQNLPILNKIRQPSSSEQPQDFVLLQVDEIKISRKVRPGCLYYQFFNRQSQGWFARYSKPERVIKTLPGRRPIFMSPMDENVTAFKVRTTGEAKIIFSKTGLPYRKEFHYQIAIGTANNTESLLSRSDAPNYSRPPTPINMTRNILSAEQFRGFWIHHQAHEVNVGKEDSEDPFLIYDDHLSDFNLPVMGIYTPNSTGEWIVHDYRASASLHDFEVEVMYTDECKEALGEYLRQEDEKEINDASVFCVKGVGRKIEGIRYGPCNNDWGGVIQIMDERLFCMWQVFGMFMKESPRNCSEVEIPSLFKSLNRPTTIRWIEDIIFSNFSIFDVNLERPKCVGPHRG